ncbi:MAG: hypothetical protein B7Z10_11100 [Rhodobacterales bacterium 32-66-7]|nr:MAG: hypothetical protein B7Z31_09745 [Rhodobacterales bacterium 12-65-15]OYX23466.1 MAG: hypothetical protein B7Z10_11100 [Rhodobacterales bacterium 32-66-7]
MTGLGEQIAALARLSVEDPRAGVRSLLAQGVPLPARTLGLVLIAVASALLLHLSFLLLPPPEDPLAGFMIQSPVRTAIVQWLFLAATVLLIFWVGRAFGGRGNLPDTLLVVVWLQVIMIAVQLAQLVALVISPPLAGLINIAGFFLFFWLFASFVAELHGFQSRWAVFGGILATGFGVALLIAVAMVIILGPEAFVSV